MKTVKQILSFLFQLFLMLVIPFWLLIRGSVFLYESYDWHYFPALFISGLVVALILLVYVAMVWDLFFGAKSMSRSTIKGKMIFVLILMAIYTGFSLYNLSGKNAKSTEVKKEFTSLHPFLRLAVGTLVWVDSDVLITDASRKTEDYKQMGLKSKKRSLHYKQANGYVHAMDLRTKGHSNVRNYLIKTYFRMMGFNTLRHVGTADHLHVSLSVKDQPGAI